MLASARPHGPLTASRAVTGGDPADCLRGYRDRGTFHTNRLPAYHQHVG